MECRIRTGGPAKVIRLEDESVVVHFNNGKGVITFHAESAVKNKLMKKI